MAATMTAAGRATRPLGLMRPVPRGSGAPRRVFGHQRPAGADGREQAAAAPTGYSAAGWDTRAAAQALFGELRRLGMRRVYGLADAKVSVLSLPGGVTVWVRGGAFSWRDTAGRAVRWSAEDVVGAARLLLAEVEQR